MNHTNTRRIALTTFLVAITSGGCAADGEARRVELDPNLAVDVASLRCTAPESACKPIEIAIASFGSSYELDTQLAGAWQFCGGAEDRGLFGAGLELTPDRELYVLEPATDGSCRRTTVAPAADWYTFDISEQNPSGTYQLVLAWRRDGSTTSFVPKFSSSASGLIDGFGGFEFRKLAPH